MSKLIKTCLIAATLLCLTACNSNHAIVVEPGTVSVLSKPIKGAQVLTPDATGSLVGCTVDLPEGTNVKFPAAQKGLSKGAGESQCVECNKQAEKALKATHAAMLKDLKAAQKQELKALKENRAACGTQPVFSDANEPIFVAPTPPIPEPGTLPESGVMKGVDIAQTAVIADLQRRVSALEADSKIVVEWVKKQPK